MRSILFGLAATFLCSAPLELGAQHPASGAHQGRPAEPDRPGAMSGGPAHDHGASTPAVSYAELQRTAELLAAARQATIEYHDVRVAEAAGYRPVGPHVPGMGVHYVRAARTRGFDIADPPILLYERDPAAPGVVRLTGVSYLLVGRAGDDGQPLDAPFPKALARWHKHNNVCVLPDASATIDLTESQCESRGGRFTAETSWMVHAWIWKDSPAGLFSPTNPLVK